MATNVTYLILRNLSAYDFQLIDDESLKNKTKQTNEIETYSLHTNSSSGYDDSPTQRLDISSPAPISLIINQINHW